MVKKKSPPKKKAAATKKAPARAAKKGGKKAAAFDGAKARKRAARPARRKSPEQQELIPGVRFAELDRYCKNIGDNRDDVNQLKGEGKSLEMGALKAMRIRGVTNYKGSGVLLSIIPGDEKLLVKKDRNNSASDGGQVDSGGDDGAAETGAGQDPGEIGAALTEGDGDE